MNRMKSIHYIYYVKTLTLSATLLLVLAACFDSEVNRNKYEVDGKQMGWENYAIGSTLKGMQGLVSPTKEHLYQFMDAMVGGSYGGYMEGIVDTWKMKFSTFNPEESWQKGPFNDIITDTYPQYRELIARTDDPVALALGKVLRVSIMHRVTDIYGPIPYSNMLNKENSGSSLSVSYDSQEKVYEQMFKELEEANQVLTDNRNLGEDAFKKLDDVYYGNIQKWLNYLHSLQLRMAMRISYVQPAQAQRIAEKAVREGVIEKNDDNALLHVAENRSALLFNDWNDYRMSADLVSYMKGYKDPRLEKMFVKGTLSKPDGTKVQDYYGVRIGIITENKDQMINLYSKQIIISTDPYLWMNAAEVAFLRAEGALKNWAMGGTAKELYERAITLSFEEHGASGADSYMADKASAPIDYEDPMGKSEYNHAAMSSVTIAWNEQASDPEENLERIIVQKWIAIYPLGLEAWAEHRRTGYPRLFPSYKNDDPKQSVDVNIGIRRLPYPATEYGIDREHILEAIQLLGGPDAGGTRLWWDVREH